MSTKKRASTKSRGGSDQGRPKGGRPLSLGEPDKPITIRTDRKFRELVDRLADEQNWDRSQVIRVCVMYVASQKLDLRDLYRELTD